MPPRGGGVAPGREELRFIVACASTAPSGGNMQPWRFEADGDVIRAWIDPTRSSLLDFRHRAALLALGAAREAAEIGARALGFEPVAATGRGGRGGVGARAAAVDAHARRERGRAAVAALQQPAHGRHARHRAGRAGSARPTAARRSTRASWPVTRSRSSARALGALDRVRFLSSRLRRDLIGELRFTAAEAHASRDGIDVASLELDDADLAAMDVLRTGAGMELLAGLDRGWGLGNAARDAFATSAGAIVLRVAAVDQGALLDAGRGLMRLWLEATRRELAIHPWGSPFLFQRLLEDRDSLEGWERTALTRAAGAFGRLVGLERDRPVMLILRVSRGAPPSVALAAPPGRRRAGVRGVGRRRCQLGKIGLRADAQCGHDDAALRVLALDANTLARRTRRDLRAPLPEGELGLVFEAVMLRPGVGSDGLALGGEMRSGAFEVAARPCDDPRHAVSEGERHARLIAGQDVGAEPLD